MHLQNGICVFLTDGAL